MTSPREASLLAANPGDVMVIDPGIRNLGLLCYEKATGHVKLWSVRSLLPMGRVHVPWSEFPKTIREFLARNAAWFHCGAYYMESQYVSRNVIQRVETCLQAYLEVLPEKPVVYVYPATKIRRGLGIPCCKEWGANKRANVQKVDEILETHPDAARLQGVFRKGSSIIRHNLADTFLPYYFFHSLSVRPTGAPVAPPLPLPSPSGAHPCS